MPFCSITQNILINVSFWRKSEPEKQKRAISPHKCSSSSDPWRSLNTVGKNLTITTQAVITSVKMPFSVCYFSIRHGTWPVGAMLITGLRLHSTDKLTRLAMTQAAFISEIYYGIIIYFFRNCWMGALYGGYWKRNKVLASWGFHKELHILLINWEWGHYREISFRGLYVLTER